MSYEEEDTTFGNGEGKTDSERRESRRARKVTDQALCLSSSLSLSCILLLI